MITSFTDRHPTATALLLILGLFLVPAGAMVLDDFVMAGAMHAASVFFWLSVAVQLTLFIAVERPILIAEPFIIGLVGLCAGEVLYAVAQSSNAPGSGPGFLMYTVSSYLIAVCGANAAAAVGALILYIFFIIGRKVYEHYKYR